ncbi:carboxypeptidase regulatory-like domain-containing protein [Patescibacteria group bacterium]|nr:carboxypeptidase regulatory-like domain-containing protein [Patescibacteria group bacterium]
MNIDKRNERHTFEICLGLIMSALLLVSGASAAATTYSIIGHVTNADNTGISGITVCTYSNNICQKTSAPTDDLGKYTITGLKKGTYSVKVNVDDRNEQYFYLPLVNPLTNKAPNFVSAVTVVSSDISNIDFKKQNINEATSGFRLPMDYDHYGSTFGQYMDYLSGEGFHNGQDYNSESNNGTCANGIKGTPNYAVAEGTIVDIRSKADSDACNPKAWGAVTIKHWYKGKAYYSNYLHISLDTENPVKIGQKVTKETIVGYEDNIMPKVLGKKNVHLHFEIKNDQDQRPYDKDSYTFTKDNIYKWYEHPDAFIASSGPYSDNPTIVVDDRELLYTGEDPLPSRWFSVNDETKFTHVPANSEITPSMGFGGSIQYAITTTGSTPSASGTWSFDIPKEGNYEIFAYIPRYNGESEKAEYKIDGSPISPLVNQVIIEDNWVKLGDLHYLTIGTHSIQLDNNVGEVGKKLAYDAIKVAYKASVLTVISPNGGEGWNVGSTQKIQWKFTNLPAAPVKIELQQGTSLFTELIVLSASTDSNGDGSYLWTIPMTHNLGTDYKIIVTSVLDTRYSDASDGYFAIQGVCTPPPLPKLDLVFLIDTTGSMWDDIVAVKLSANEIVEALDSKGLDYRVAIADYRDYPELPYGGTGDYVYNLNLPFSNDTDSIISSINGLSLGWGADWPESVYSALVHAMEDQNKDPANGDNSGWRFGATKAIIIMADAPPHMPIEPWPEGHNLADVISVSESIDPVVVYSIVIGSDQSTYDAFSEISNGTNGKVYSSPQAFDVVAAILEAIGDIGQTPENRGVLLNITPAVNKTTAGNSASYTVNVTNIGNLNDIYDISLELNNFVGFQRGYLVAIQPSWVNFNSTQITLDPGMSEIRPLKIAVPVNWAGMEDVTYSFNVTATSTANASIGNTSSAELKVKADKRSMAEYSKLEIQWLRKLIQGSKIDKGIKNALLSKLANAESKVDVAIANVGNSKFGSNLNTAENMMTAFNNQVEAQYDKKIMQPDAAEIKKQGNQIITDLEKAKNS